LSFYFVFKILKIQESFFFHALWFKTHFLSIDRSKSSSSASCLLCFILSFIHHKSKKMFSCKLNLENFTTNSLEQVVRTLNYTMKMLTRQEPFYKSRTVKDELQNFPIWKNFPILASAMEEKYDYSLILHSIQWEDRKAVRKVDIAKVLMDKNRKDLNIIIFFKDLQNWRFIDKTLRKKKEQVYIFQGERFIKNYASFLFKICQSLNREGS